MNNEELEIMAKVIKENTNMCGVNVGCGKTSCSHCIAECLLRNGFGYVKQSIKEFVKRVNDELENCIMENDSEFNDGYNDCIFDAHGLINNIYKELYGEDEKETKND